MLNYWRLREALRTGRYEVVEGTVTDFVPMPKEGDTKGQFVVNGHHYQHSDHLVTRGINNTQSQSGPIRAGLRVRIADVGGKIARLEIARSSDLRPDTVSRTAQATERSRFDRPLPGSDRVPMQLFYKYFWFFGLPFGLLVTWVIWTALKKVIEKGLLDQSSAVRFTQIFGCWFSLPPFFVGVFQWLGGYERPDYFSASAPNEPYAFAAWLVIVAYYLFLIPWIWWGSAAVVVLALLTRYMESFPRNTFLLKVIVTVLAIVSALVWTFKPPTSMW
jgi:hypothetical protein